MRGCVGCVPNSSRACLSSAILSDPNLTARSNGGAIHWTSLLSRCSRDPNGPGVLVDASWIENREAPSAIRVTSQHVRDGALHLRAIAGGSVEGEFEVRDD